MGFACPVKGSLVIVVNARCVRGSYHESSEVNTFNNSPNSLNFPHHKIFYLKGINNDKFIRFKDKFIQQFYSIGLSFVEININHPIAMLGKEYPSPMRALFEIRHSD
jgi:hypothetical protein